MNLNDIGRDMFTGLTETTKMLVVRGLKPELSMTINAINVKFGQLPTNTVSVNKITPPICDIMNAFRACPIESTRIVLIGQDPYTAIGVAMGMSFGARNKVPPSLANIYKCLHHNGLIKQIPTCGDLTPWANQGILLLNAALTTIVGKSNEHAVEWEPYTNALIRDISLIPRPLIFILLGKFAQSKAQFIKNQHVHSILMWGHPSPINSVNNSIANLSNFIYCNAFSKTNEILIARGDTPIIWDIGINKLADGLADKPADKQVDGLAGGFADGLADGFTDGFADKSADGFANGFADKLMDKPMDKPVDGLATDTGIAGNKDMQIDTKDGNTQIAPLVPLVHLDPLAPLVPLVPLVYNHQILRKILPIDLAPPINLSAGGSASNYLWAFTDGGALANGKSHCKASWGFYVTCGDYCAEDGGVVPLIDIPGEVFKTSNQRAELLALLKCLEFISLIGINSEIAGFKTVTIITDSEYSINCISVWYAGWIKKPEHLLTRKNTDIIAPAYYLLESLKTKYDIVLQHIRSHPIKKDIPTAGTLAWFLYKGNDIVDKICEKINMHVSG